MENRIFYLISKTENIMSVYIKQQFLKSGLKVTPVQLGILYILKIKNMQSMTELSRELGTDNSAVTRSVDRLEKNGLVERKNSTNDRREYLITITEAGITETENAKKIISAVNKKIEKEFTAKELDDFKQSLVKMGSLFSAQIS
jgi:DNA-binding MarR family transcriptional regulator